MIGFTLTASTVASKPRAAVAEPTAPTMTGDAATPVPAPRMVRFGFGSHMTQAAELVTVHTDPKTSVFPK